MRVVLLAAVIAAGCDPDPITQTQTFPDAGVLVPGPNVVALHLGEYPPTYIAYRNLVGTWGDPETITNVEAQLHVGDAYELLYTCETEYGVDTWRYARAFSDGDELWAECGFAPLALPPTVTVSGEMLQPGDVWLPADVATSQTAPWTYHLETYRGPNDLIATDPSRRIAIRRGLSITESTTLPTLDMAAEGQPLVAHPISIYGEVLDETLRATAYLGTETNLAPILGTDSMLYVPPPGMLQPLDFIDVAVAASTTHGARGVQMPYDAEQTAYVLPPVLSPHALAYSVPDNRSLRGDWTDIPAFDVLELSIYSAYASETMSVTKAYVEASQQNYVSLAVPHSFLRDWKVNLSAPYMRVVQLTEGTESLRYAYEYSVVENVLGN